MTGVAEQLKTNAAVAEERRGRMPAAAPETPETKPQAPVAVLVEHLTKRFVVGRRKKPVVAIDDVSLVIRRGEIYGVLGANGSGKSTLIRLMSTLLTLDSGRVEVFGHDIERDEMAVKRLINRPGRSQGKGRCGRDPRAAGHQREAAWPPAGADEPRHAAEGRHRAGAADQPGADAPGRADHRPRPAVQAGGAVLRRGAAGHA
jgi:energy-coupling factor transporter ATP-binding protein EcfA2